VQLHTQVLGDASKNVCLWCRGWVGTGDHALQELFSLDQFKPDQRGVKARTLSLVSALWTLQEKLGFYVWTEPDRRPDHLLLIMESRNFIRFDREMPLEEWGGKLYLEAFNVPEPKLFWFQLEFDKILERS
jgi:hypothetical protein